MPSKDAENEIRTVMQEWGEAFVAKDVDKIMTYFADGDSFSAFDVMPPIEFHGGEMWRQNWVNYFAAWEGPWTSDPHDTRIYASEDVAFARSLVRQSGTIKGEEIVLWARQTICFVKTDGRWLMVHNHASVPIDFATGKARLDLSPSHPG